VFEIGSGGCWMPCCAMEGIRTFEIRNIKLSRKNMKAETEERED